MITMKELEKKIANLQNELVENKEMKLEEAKKKFLPKLEELEKLCDIENITDYSNLIKYCNFVMNLNEDYLKKAMEDYEGYSATPSEMKNIAQALNDYSGSFSLINKIGNSIMKQKQDIAQMRTYLFTRIGKESKKVEENTKS